MIGHCQTDLADSQKIVFVFSSARMILTSSYCFVCIQNTQTHTLTHTCCTCLVIKMADKREKWVMWWRLFSE